MRKGQFLFNKLYEIDPVLANEIRGSDTDPFYDDNKIMSFKDKVIDKLGLFPLELKEAEEYYEEM